MGIVKVSFYSVECNHCKCLLEDYTGELARITPIRGFAEKIAKQNGFVQFGKIHGFVRTVLKNIKKINWSVCQLNNVNNLRETTKW